MAPKRPSNSQTITFEGLDGIDVQLWEPHIDPKDAADLIASFYCSTWNDLRRPHEWTRSGDDKPYAPWQIAQDAMAGKVLPNTLETIKLTFGIEGVSRACTHQLVRSRVGVVFGQQGGRDNNWEESNQKFPKTFRQMESRTLSMVKEHQRALAEIYGRMLRNGVPFQDARYILPMGLTTNLVGSYNLLALQGTMARRLCNRMMWETNYVFRLIHDLVVTAYPWVGRNLRSGCEKRGVCGSVSPMFPPSDFHWDWEKGDVQLVKDNETLSDEIGKGSWKDSWEDDGTYHDSLYDWPRSSNGCWLHFREIDKARIYKEAQEQDIVMSLVKPDLILAYFDHNVGEWRKECNYYEKG